jgi:hypothetical protein
MLITCIVLAARPIRSYILIIGGWDQLVDIEKVVEAIHVTLKFLPCVVLQLYAAYMTSL